MESIPISKFADLGFCELKIVYHFLEARKPSFSTHVYLGGKQHAVSAYEDSLKPRTSVSLNDLLEALKDSESIIEFPSESVHVKFESRGFIFRGRIDKLIKSGRIATVIDEKFTNMGSSIFADKYTTQLCAYCNGLANGKTIVSGIELGERVFAGLLLTGKVIERDIESRALLRESCHLEFHESKFTPLVERFTKIMKGDFDRKELACRKPEKCALCEYRNRCEYRAI